MKPRLTRMLSMILCAVMVLAVFAGCVSGGKNPSDTTPGGEVTTESPENPAYINYRGENLTITDGTNPITTGARVPAGTVITVSYNNTAVVDKIATIKLNKEAWLTAQPGENVSKTFTTEANIMYSITVELAVLELELTIGDGITVVNKADGEAILNGAKVPYGTEIAVTVESNDKLKITKLSVNDTDTDVMVVNATRTLSYTVTEKMEFTVAESNYPIVFEACSQNFTEQINSRTQGIDQDSGYLVGPNFDEYSQTGFVTLPKNAVFTTTVKMNRGYNFGINLFVSEDPTAEWGADGLTYYRVSARPWFRVDGVGDFHNNYIQLNQNGTSTNIELSEMPVNDEVTLRLVLDSENNKTYLFVNNEELTEQAGITVTAEDFVRINFYYLCERDQEAGVYKTWNIKSGAEAVAQALSESRPATFAFDNAKLSVVDGDKNVENGGNVNAGKTVTVSYDNSAENNNVAVVKANGTELFRVLPNQKGSEPVLAKAFETYTLTVEFVEAEKVTVNVATGLTVVKKADSSSVADGASVPKGTILLVTLSSDDKTKIVSLSANEVDTLLKVVNATQTFEYSVMQDTALAAKEESYPIHFEACSTKFVEEINNRTQGLNSDGYLFGPNFNEYSQTEFVKLNQDAVVTVNLKINRGYSFGINMYISEDPTIDWGSAGLTYYRVNARPWMRVDGVGGFHSDHIEFNNNGSVNRIAFAEGAPDDDEVTLKLIFDHTNGKAYVYVNGEDYTDRAAVPFTSNDWVRLNFYNLCELDETPGLYKTWSVESGAEAVANALAAMRIATVTYTDAKLSVKDGDTPVASGSEIPAGKTLTIAYDNTAESTNTARIRVNGEILFEVAPGMNGNQTLPINVGTYELTVELAAPNVTLTYTNGMTVTDALGQPIASGSSLANGTVVRVTLVSDDKQKIETLYANGTATDLFTVNATQTVSYSVLADTELTIVETDYPIHFEAASSRHTAEINSRTQGIDGDGYLFGPNFNEYSQTGFVKLNQDAVVTVNLKMNRGYSFGINMYISEDPTIDWGSAGLTYYRVNARPWMRVDGVGGFHSDHIEFNNNGSVNRIAFAEGAPDDDEVTLKLIFDHTNGKAYVYVNGEDYTDRAAVPFTSNDWVRLNFYNLCELDETPGLYKTWSITTGAEAVAAALAAN